MPSRTHLTLQLENYTSNSGNSTNSSSNSEEYIPWNCWINGLEVGNDTGTELFVNITNCSLNYATLYDVWFYVESMTNQVDGFLFKRTIRTVPSNELVKLTQNVLDVSGLQGSYGQYKWVPDQVEGIFGLISKQSFFNFCYLTQNVVRLPPRGQETFGPSKPSKKE